jgi:hypothetical protein
MGGVVEQQRQQRKVQRAEVCDEVVPETRTINQKREVEVGLRSMVDPKYFAGSCAVGFGGTSSSLR